MLIKTQRMDMQSTQVETFMSTIAQEKQRKPLSIPLKVYQDDFRPGRGNALQAAVASIFGLNLETVPNFVEMPNGYEDAIRDFYQGSIKLSLANDQTMMLKGEQMYHGKLCILRGKSPRGDHGHVVVSRFQMPEGKFEMLHDPHPDETFLDEAGKLGWAMFFL